MRSWVWGQVAGHTIPGSSRGAQASYGFDDLIERKGKKRKGKEKFTLFINHKTMAVTGVLQG